MEPLLVTDPSIPLRFLLGGVAGVLATLFMDAVMARLPEGETSPFVASGVLTDTPPRNAPGRLAAVVHYVAGGLTGPLFIWLLFAVVVLPRSLAPSGRVGRIRRDWALSAAAYLLVLVPVVTLGSGPI